MPRREVSVAWRDAPWDHRAAAARTRPPVTPTSAGRAARPMAFAAMLGLAIGLVVAAHAAGADRERLAVLLAATGPAD